MNDWLAWHLHPATGPKRILSLDGGGVRGLITLGILQRIEDLLKVRSANPDQFRLAHYFDLIAGTSTGSIIATALALGWTVQEIKALYEELAPIAFKEKAKGFFRPKFDAAVLEKRLEQVLGHEELQSDKLLTGLMICAKRIDTGSPWVLTNNPGSKYWESPDRRYMPNKEYALRMVVRASTAAPLYYDPVEVTITADHGIYPEQRGLFIDGAVGGHNNPSLQALLVATLPAYGFSWPKGEANLMIVSVGTGTWRIQHGTSEFMDKYNWQKAADALSAMIQDTVLHAVTTMQALSQPRKPWPINSELGDMREQMIVDAPLLTYQRFDARIEADVVTRVCNVRDQAGPAAAKLLNELRQLGNTDKENLKRLFALGHDCTHTRQAGVDGIEPEDFPAHFDPPFMRSA